MAHPLDEIAPITGFEGSKQGGIHRDAEKEESIAPQVIFSDSKEETRERGQELAQSLSDSDCHPVLLFGGATSGKTTILLSLLKYINTVKEANATISLQTDALPPGDKWNVRRTNAETLYNKDAYGFVRQQAPSATNASDPFFIPVEIIPQGAPPKKFAFLEGQGDWYHADWDRSNPHREFRVDITEFLRTFTRPVSVIYVAPYAVGGYKSAEISEAAKSNKLIQEVDYALSGIISQYENLRRTFTHRDQHLFLLTKWDIRCGSIAQPQFTNYLEVLDEEIEKKYPLSFKRFGSIISGVSAPNNKVKGAYCAGIFNENRRIAPLANSDKESLDLFPRELWDWIYFSACQTPLYEDVRAKPLSVFDKMMQLIRGD